MSDIASCKFRFEAGRLIKGELVRALRDAAFQLNLDFEINEDKGFFESYFYGKVTGKIENVNRFKYYVTHIRED